MSATCQDVETLLALRATDALASDERARVERHLASCAACAAAAAALAELLDLARLPQPSLAELRALDAMPRRIRGALRHARRRRIAGAAAAAFAVAAAVAVVAWVPPRGRPAQPPAPQVAASWQEPDLDALWDEAGVLDADGAGAVDGVPEDAAAL